MKRNIFIFFFLISGFILYSQNENPRDLLEKSELFYQNKEYDSAYVYALESLELSEKLQIDSLINRSRLELLYPLNKINPSQTDSLYQLVLDSALSGKDNTKITEAYFTRGKLYYGNRDMADALPYYLKVDSMSQKYGFKNHLLVQSLIDRSEISRRTFDNDGVEIARKMQLEAMDIAKEINDENSINDIYVLLADMNGMMGNLEDAKKYTDSAYSYFKRVEDFHQLRAVYFTYMNYYYATDNYDAAGDILNEAIDYYEKKGREEDMAYMLVQYGNYFRKRKKDCSMAIVEYEKAKAIYDKLENTIQNQYVYITEGLGLCYAETKDFEKAYLAYQTTYETKKALVKKANNELSRNLETKYRTEKKEQEIELLKSQNELAEAQKRNQRNALLGGIGLTSLLGLFFFYQYRNRQKTNNKLKELDTAKSTFFANISHEFRTPLTLIKGPLEDQLQSKDLSAGERINLVAAQNNTKRLESLVEQLLALSKLESGKLKLKVQPGNLSQFIAVQAEAFAFSCQEKHINFIVDVQSDTSTHWFDRDAMEKILFNLIGNAVKYSPEHGKVAIAGALEGDKYKISVSNTGTYIEPEQRGKIFERFYQTQTENPGTGIGLALTKELTALHRGSISVHSEPDVDTNFEVIVPISKNSFSASEILTEELHQGELELKEVPLEASVNTLDIEEDAPVLLLVDDNNEIRSYLASIFENTFDIYQATNGKAGYEKAREIVPDVIISDVMMPEEDGFVLTANLKKNELTSHIPVVLLTARTEDEDKLHGVETGADAYITKPFSSQFLKATVDNLLETRRKLQERFAQEVILKPQEISVSSADEKFIERLQKVFDEHLTNPDFSVDNCAREMGVSRMQLHRKLKALTGLSTSRFINSQRLKLAEKILKTEKITVSEVGYSVGFNDPSYFAKCFKNAYGCSPSEFA